MTYQQERQAKLKQQRGKQAVDLAMQGRWREAVAVNKLIIESFPNDVEAYNRLGRAYMELGEYSPAREAYQRTVELDPYNTIAQRNLRRLSHLGETMAGTEGKSHKAEAQHFIQEIGKAGIVNLDNLAPKEILAKVASGDRVELKIEGHNLDVENHLGEHLGEIEPKHAQRLIKLMMGGNKYSAATVSAAEDKITVIIREEYQDPGQAGQLSFPPKGVKGLRSSAGDKMLKAEPEHEEELPEEPHDVEEERAGNEN